MATKTKKSTKTASRKAATKTHKKCATRTNCKKGSKELTNAERMHVCAVAALSIMVGILLCTDAAIMAAV